MKKSTQYIFRGALVTGLVLMPAASFAAVAAVRTLRDLIELVIDYLGMAIPLIMSLAIVMFIWGVYKYFFKPDASREEAGNFILYSVLGFFLMLSFWGIVNILINTLNLDSNIPNGGIPFVGTSGVQSIPSGSSFRTTSPSSGSGSAQYNGNSSAQYNGNTPNGDGSD